MRCLDRTATRSSAWLSAQAQLQFVKLVSNNRHFDKFGVVRI